MKEATHAGEGMGDGSGVGLVGREVGPFVGSAVIGVGCAIQFRVTDDLEMATCMHQSQSWCVGLLRHNA